MFEHLSFPDKIVRMTAQDDEKDTAESIEHTIAEKISGFGQKVLGEIETLGGILTADPITQAEGEFNVEVGEIREEIEEDIENKAENEAERLGEQGTE